MTIIVIWLGCAVVSGMIGNSKGRGFGDGFMFGAVFGIFGLIYVAVSNPPAPRGMKHVRCPRCGAKQNILTSGGECWQCETQLGGGTHPVAAPVAKVAVMCPLCRAEQRIPTTAAQFKCARCKEVIDAPA